MNCAFNAENKLSAAKITLDDKQRALVVIQPVLDGGFLGFLAEGSYADVALQRGAGDVELTGGVVDSGLIAVPASVFSFTVNRPKLGRLTTNQFDPLRPQL